MPDVFPPGAETVQTEAELVHGKARLVRKLVRSIRQKERESLGRTLEDKVKDRRPAEVPEVRDAVRRALDEWEGLEDEFLAEVGGPPSLQSAALVRAALRRRLLQSSEARLFPDRAKRLNAEAKACVWSLIAHPTPPIGDGGHRTLDLDKAHTVAADLVGSMASNDFWCVDRFPHDLDSDGPVDAEALRRHFERRKRAPAARGSGGNTRVGRSSPIDQVIDVVGQGSRWRETASSPTPEDVVVDEENRLEQLAAEERRLVGVAQDHGAFVRSTVLEASAPGTCFHGRRDWLLDLLDEFGPVLVCTLVLRIAGHDYAEITRVLECAGFAEAACREERLQTWMYLFLAGLDRNQAPQATSGLPPDEAARTFVGVLAFLKRSGVLDLQAVTLCALRCYSLLSQESWSTTLGEGPVTFTLAEQGVLHDDVRADVRGNRRRQTSFRFFGKSSRHHWLAPWFPEEIEKRDPAAAEAHRRIWARAARGDCGPERFLEWCRHRQARASTSSD